MSSKKVTTTPTTKKQKAIVTTPTITTTSAENLEKDMQVVPITKDFDFSRIMYSEAKEEKIPGGGLSRRVQINYNYGDGKFGPLCVQTGKVYSYGVQPNNVDKDGKIVIDENTGQPKALTGYKVPLVMLSKGEPTDEELTNVDFFDNLKLEIQRYAVENKEALGKKSKNDDFVSEQVGDILFRKKENDVPIDGYVPKLYPALMYYHKKKEMATVFYGPGDEQIDPLTVEGHFYIEPTIKIESLWVASKTISIQCKLYDATITPISRAPKKRLAPAATKVTINNDDGETETPDGEAEVQSDNES